MSLQYLSNAVSPGMLLIAAIPAFGLALNIVLASVSTMQDSLQEALNLARRERPDALPAGFPMDVMARLETEPAAPALSVRGTVVMGLAGLMAAAAVSYLANRPVETEEPPPLAMFGRAAAQAPFATP